MLHNYTANSRSHCLSGQHLKPNLHEYIEQTNFLQWTSKTQTHLLERKVTSQGERIKTPGESPPDQGEKPPNLRGMVQRRPRGLRSQRETIPILLREIRRARKSPPRIRKAAYGQQRQNSKAEKPRFKSLRRCRLMTTSMTEQYHATSRKTSTSGKEL
jgi:hypothetical protein